MVVHDIGLELKPPRSGCNDPVCPYHGQLSVRGRIFEGTVAAARSPKTVSVERGYLHYYPKYNRYERRRSKILAHNPPCIAATLGERVTIAECRPLSKEVNFVVVNKASEAIP
jgi:small subunit ribosomal protein S17